MWLFVMFDLPTGTKKERDAATRFRKDLMRDGFTRMQYSVYIRHCPSGESAETFIRRIESYLPDYGQVTILRVTDKQFGSMLHFYRSKPHPGPETPVQLAIF
ncbi:MAG: CRISPR-associated protein Cas2 [Chlorobi bacterium NICIL-2]|nr:MAG: CRISPR-associated protein Cas2 [Chlorobi bacterium NICIL-2]GIV55299.1 MAG: CRISPR-associated endoribonuclease Cas2 [Candidatus Kapabacteria bacterium]